MKSSHQTIPSFPAIVGKDLYNFSLEPLRFPPNTHVQKPEVYLNYRYILQHPDPPLPLILSYQNVNRFFYKTQFTASSAQVYYFNADHVCVLDHEQMRCKVCGISLKWCFMADGFIMKNFNIDFIEVDQLSSEFIFLRQIKNFSTLRKFISFVLDRPLGQGFEDLYMKNGKYPNELFHELGGIEKIQSQSTDPFKIFADFENSNMLAFQIINLRESFVVKIIMRGDTNSLLNGFTQWFFFKVIAKKQLTLSIEIINFRKKISNSDEDKSNTLCCYDFDSDGVNKTWKFIEENVKYFKNPPMEPKEEKTKGNQEEVELMNSEWYTLKFNYSFESPKEVLFSLTYPYTFSSLIEFLSRQEKKLFAKGIKEQEFDYKKKEILLENEQVSYNRIVLGSTVCGLPLILLQITSSKYQDPDLYFPAKYKQKKYILIIARQHPGEPPSSHVAEGIISFLMSEDTSAQILRTFFVFLIVPMMNPDGVILGNNRTGFKGSDFNRNWRSPTAENEPEIVMVKELVGKLIKEGKKVSMFFDLHGHSHKKGVFVYSTPPSILKDWEVNEDGILEWGKSSLLTNIMASNCKYICVENCKSRFGKGKDESARMVMCKDFEIQHSYTIETSFSSYIDKKSKDIIRFKIEDLKLLGKDIMMAILEFHTVLADHEAAKATKNKTEVTQDNYFCKFLSKTKRFYPEFKNSWKEYFSEAQLQKLYNKLEKFVNIMNENLFPIDKESPSKAFETPPVATEQTLKEFYESTLFDNSASKNGLSPYVISNSSSFSSNHDLDEINEEILEQIEREEHKKILGMMLFHEKDLKKTEKLLKKKAMKKTMNEKQNKNAFTSPNKKIPSSSNKNFMQSSQRTLVLEKRASIRRTMLDIQDPSVEGKVKSKTCVEVDQNKKATNSKYFIPSKIESNSNERNLTPISRNSITNLKETISYENPSFGINSSYDNLGNEPYDERIRFRDITPNPKSNFKGTTTKDVRERAKTKKETNHSQRTANKGSLQISTGPQYNTTASTNFGTSQSKLTTASSGKRKVHDFFDEHEKKKNTISNEDDINMNEALNQNSRLEMEEQSLIINDSQNLLKFSDQRVSKVQKTIDIAQINIPEEESEWTKRKNSWNKSNRPKTATNMTQQEKIRFIREFEHSQKKTRRKNTTMQAYFKNTNVRNEENSKEALDISEHYPTHFQKSPLRGENSLEHYYMNKTRSKLTTNPFIKSKKEIYQLYSFKKPLIMLNERTKNIMKTCPDASELLPSNNEILRSEETFKESIGSFVEEGKGEENSKVSKTKYKPFQILKKSFV